jgi:hypothetical protein
MRPNDQYLAERAAREFIPDRWKGYGGLGSTWCFYSREPGEER